MFAIIIGLIVIALVVTLLLKGYYPQAILFMGGVVLLTCTAIFGWGDLLNAKQTTNFIGFDIFKVFSTGFSSRIAGLGLTLMAIGGFSRYMEHVGASAALFSVFEKPLKLIKSPYVLLGASFLVSQIMVIFVPSHAGLALLLMVTLYPILIRSGVSPMSALGVIGCAQFVDVGPGSGNAILAAQTAGVDVSEYFVYYQLPLFVGVVIILTFVHMFVQRWWDKREGWVFDPNNIQTLAGTKNTAQDKKVPKIYAILPIIPLFLIIFFSKVAGSHIRMDVVTAMVKEIERIDVATYKVAFDLTSQLKTATEDEAKFSLPFCFAISLLKGSVSLANFSQAVRTDPEVLDLARRVHVIESPEATSRFPHRQAEVSIVMKDGTVYADKTLDAHDSTTPEQIVAKFEAAVNEMDASKRQRIIQFVIDLGKQQSIAPLMDLLA